MIGMFATMTRNIKVYSIDKSLMKESHSVLANHHKLCGYSDLHKGGWELHSFSTGVWRATETCRESCRYFMICRCLPFTLLRKLRVDQTHLCSLGLPDIAGSRGVPGKFNRETELLESLCAELLHVMQSSCLPCYLNGFSGETTNDVILKKRLKNNQT